MGTAPRVVCTLRSTTPKANRGPTTCSILTKTAIATSGTMRPPTSQGPERSSPNILRHRHDLVRVRARAFPVRIGRPSSDRAVAATVALQGPKPPAWFRRRQRSLRRVCDRRQDLQGIPRLWIRHHRPARFGVQHAVSASRGWRIRGLVWNGDGPSGRHAVARRSMVPVLLLAGGRSAFHLPLPGPARRPATRGRRPPREAARYVR